MGRGGQQPKVGSAAAGRRADPELDTYVAVADAVCGRWDGEAVVWPNGDRVYLEISDMDDHLVLHNIRAEPEGRGGGGEVLSALQRQGRPIRAVEVMQPGFFAAFGFREQEDWDEEYEGSAQPDMWWLPSSRQD